MSGAVLRFCSGLRDVDHVVSLDLRQRELLNANNLHLRGHVETAIAKSLRAGGKKLTKARKAILSVLERNTLPITAAEVHAALVKARTDVDLVTVYRNLAMLQELGLVNAVGFHEGQMRYEVVHGRAHHHHIQCRSCGKIVDLMLCPLKKLTKLIEEQTRFSVDGHALEFLDGVPNAGKDISQVGEPVGPHCRLRTARADAPAVAAGAHLRGW